MVGTVDLLYTRTMNQFYLNDVNIQGVQSTETGEGGRLHVRRAPVRRTAWGSPPVDRAQADQHVRTRT